MTDPQNFVWDYVCSYIRIVSSKIARDMPQYFDRKLVGFNYVMHRQTLLGDLRKISLLLPVEVEEYKLLYNS